MEISIKPEDIERQIVESIIKSSLGKVIFDQINKNIENLAKDYQFQIAVDVVVKEHIKTIIIQEINTKYEGLIRETIRGYMTNEKVAQMIDQLWNKIRY